MSATTSSDHLHFVHSWWLLTETRPSKAKKKSRMRDLSVAATAVSFTLLPHFFLGGRWFHTSWPSIYNGRNWRLIRRSRRHPHRNSFRLFRFLTSDCDRDQRVQHLRLSLDSKFHPIVTVGSNDFEFFKLWRGIFVKIRRIKFCKNSEKL